MPMYEYLCAKCERDFEKLISSSESDERMTCPECGSHNVRKKLSLFGVGAKASLGGGTSSFGGGGCCSGGACSCH